MGRRERPLNPDEDPIQGFAFALRCLRESAGRPGYRELARRAHYSVTALAEAAGGSELPSLPVALAYAQACGGDPRIWAAHWRAAAAATAAVTGNAGTTATSEPSERLPGSAVATGADGGGGSGEGSGDDGGGGGGGGDDNGDDDGDGDSGGDRRRRSIPVTPATLMAAASTVATAVLVAALIGIELLRRRRAGRPNDADATGWPDAAKRYFLGKKSRHGDATSVRSYAVEGRPG